MIEYLLRRLIGMIVVMFLVATIVLMNPLHRTSMLDVLHED